MEFEHKGNELLVWGESTTSPCLRDDEDFNNLHAAMEDGLEIQDSALACFQVKRLLICRRTDERITMRQGLRFTAITARDGFGRLQQDLELFFQGAAVRLDVIPPSLYIRTIKTLREHLGVGLKGAKALADSCPCTITHYEPYDGERNRLSRRAATDLYVALRDLRLRDGDDVLTVDLKGW